MAHLYYSVTASFSFSVKLNLVIECLHCNTHRFIQHKDVLLNNNLASLSNLISVEYKLIKNLYTPSKIIGGILLYVYTEAVNNYSGSTSTSLSLSTMQKVST